VSLRNFPSDAPDLGTLKRRAANLRRHMLGMARRQGQGYIGQGLGIADLLAVLYFHELRHDPQNPGWAERDRFLLSTGHYSIALWAALAESGVIPVGELSTYGADGSRLDAEALVRAYAGADVFVFPSLTDTFGLVLLEALACGTPVAAFPVTGPIDVLADARGKVGAVNADLRAAALEALTADRAGEVIWTPSEPGINFAALTEIEAPAKTVAARLRQMNWIAHWIANGGALLNKPSHFEVQDGKF